MLQKTACLVLVSCAVLWSTSALADDEPRWRLGLGVGVMQIDDLAGTPFIPMLTAGRAWGDIGAGALNVSMIAGAGRYDLTALVFDLGFGLRSSGERAEFSILVGPAAIVGGDSDGTPYVGGGLGASLTGTLWLTQSVGVSAQGAARYWLSANQHFAPSLTAGLMLRL
jgi:hypothetical protein